jgi:hypothetical protein
MFCAKEIMRIGSQVTNKDIYDFKKLCAVFGISYLLDMQEIRSLIVHIKLLEKGCQISV